MKRSAAGGPLRWSDRLAYGLPAFALAVVGIPVYVHIPKFYSDVVGVDIAWMGSILMLARVFDALTDPLLGILSDRTATPMGRRRPYILFGGIGLALCLYLLFVPTRMAASAASAWFAAALFCLFLCWTVVTVPYEALGPEITADYGERTALFAVRDGLLIAGTLAAAASPAIIGALLADPAGPEAERRKFLWMALAYAPLLVGACLLCVLRIREAPAAQRRGGKPRVQDLRLVLRNRPFLILLGSYTVGAFGSNLPATLILYYVEHVLRSERADLFLFLYFVSGILMLPAWIALARRYGKKEAWLVSMAVNTLAFAGVFFLGPGDELAYGLLVVLSGLGFGATLALPSAIQADVIDYDELLSGRRQEGWYIGIWSVFKKLAAALGVGLGLTVLGAAGYVPGAEQPPGVVSALRLLYALLPCLCNLAAIGIALRFPISRRVHGEILAAIEARRAGGEAPDPLRR